MVLKLKLATKSTTTPLTHADKILIGSVTAALLSVIALVVTLGILYPPSNSSLTTTPTPSILEPSVTQTATPNITYQGNTSVFLIHPVNEYIIPITFETSSPSNITLSNFTNDFLWSPNTGPFGTVIFKLPNSVLASISWPDYAGTVVRSFTQPYILSSQMVTKQGFVFTGAYNGNNILSLRSTYANIGISYEPEVPVFTAANSINQIYMLSTTDNIVMVMFPVSNNNFRYCYYSSDLGVTWTESTNFTANNSVAFYDAIAFENRVGVLVSGLPNQFTLYESKDGGVTFGAPEALPYVQFGSQDPRIVFGPNDTTYVVFQGTILAHIGYFNGSTWATAFLIPQQLFNSDYYLQVINGLPVILLQETSLVYLHRATNVAATLWLPREFVGNFGVGVGLSFLNFDSVLLVAATGANVLLSIQTQGGMWTAPEKVSVDPNTIRNPIITGEALMLHGHSFVTNTMYFQSLPFVWPLQYTYTD